MIVDLDVMERNLVGMQTYCGLHGLSLRPHIKTHKLPRLARRPVELGAIGITCQKPGEAEVMAAAGLDDILVSYPIIGEAKAARLARLARRATMRVAIDNLLALATVASAARQAGSPIGVPVEFDSGMRRTGVATPDDALALARQVQAEPHLRLDGPLTYPSNAGSAAFVAEARSRFAACDLPIDIVSGGGTPVMWRAHEIEGSRNIASAPTPITTAPRWRPASASATCLPIPKRWSSG